MKPIYHLFLIAIVFTFTNCINVLTGVNGNGNVVTEERSIEAFNAIDASGAIKIILVKNSSNTLTVTTDENLQSHVETYVRGNTLHITSRDIGKITELEVIVNFDELEHIDLSGAVDVFTKNTLETERLEIDASGASELELDIETHRINIDMSGASEVRLTGNTNSMSFKGSGASSLNAYELKAEEVKVSISGAGEARVYASKELYASVSGAGSIRYSGEPENVRTDVSGAGSIRQK